MTKLKHYDNLGTARFITLSCHNYLNLFEDDKVKMIFLDCLSQIKHKYSLKLFGYVIMLNHVHLVVYPEKPVKIGRVIGELKSQSARHILNYFREIKSYVLEDLKVLRNGIERIAFWHRRCYDHNCRGMDSVIEKINYCHNNPVKNGLVTDVSEWKWSSYDYYCTDKYELIEIDSMEELNPPQAVGYHEG